MNTSTKTTKISAVFLATVLLAGIIAVSSPSFMAGAQAEPYYGMDNNYKKSNGKDVSVKAIKCNNINVNVNGLELNVLPPVLSGLVGSEAQASDEGERGASSYGSGNGGSYGDGRQSSSDGDFKFVCINNNNNTVVGVADGEDGDDDGGVTPPPPDGVTCEECFNLNSTVASIITEQLSGASPIVIIAPPMGLSIPGSVNDIAGLCDFLETAFASGALDQTAEDLNLVIQAILAEGPAPDPVLSAASLAELIACLLDADFETDTDT